MEGISITKLLVVGMLFGTSKLRTLGADLGAALKGFKKAMGNDDAPPTNTAAESKVATEAKPPIEHKD
ncbi:Sec-independent protein translocase subunit TatA [Yersinia enterocolitica]